jgi:NAD(P)-dependent dehydrogenase (short-subunit alcohol dehydrogenase family)
VAGACRGLGLAIAVGCAELGATVAILDVLDAPTETLAQLEAENNIKLHYFQ